MCTPPPLPSTTRKPDWWSRNWKWFIPVLCLATLLLFGEFFYIVVRFLKSNDAYRSAVAQAQHSELVQEAIGSPIETRWLVTGNVHLRGQSGRASLSIPIYGPHGEAKILLIARRTAGDWKFSHLVVRVADQGPQIDLLLENQPKD